MTKVKRDFTQGPLLRQMILFTIPLILTAILQQLFNTADTLVVGRWGGDTAEECTVALAAVGSCVHLINLIIGLLNGFSTAVSITTAHAIGGKQYEKVSRIVHTAIPTGFLGGTILCVVGFFFAKEALVLMGTDPDVLDAATIYMRAICFGFPAQLTYNYCSAAVRADGDTYHPMIFLTTAGVANLVLNMVAVIVFRAGAVGVGIATTASHWISCALIIGFMMRKSERCKVILKNLRIHWDILRQILVIGLPAGIQGSLFSISNVTVQSAINSFGKATTAGNTVAFNVERYINVSLAAIGDTTMTFVGQNVGANNYKRVKQIFLTSICLVFGVGLLVATPIYIFEESLMGLFSTDPEVIAAGMVRHNIVTFGYLLLGLMEAAAAGVRAFGWTTRAMFVSLGGSCLLRIVWINTAFAWMRDTEYALTFLYLTYPISWIVTFLLHLCFFLYAMRLMKTGRLKELGSRRKK